MVQPHRKQVRHVHSPGHLHELTFSCYQRRPLLTNDTWRAWLAESITLAGVACRAHLAAFVFMPEHVHLLVWLKEPADSISRYLRLVKGPVSRRVSRALAEHNPRLHRQLTVQERPEKSCFRFWQEGSGFDRNLYSPRAIAASIEYIHRNPVARGLVERAIDWKWSSARWHLAEPPRQAFAGLPEVYGLPSGWLESGQV